MARASILEYLENFRLHAREEAYVFRRGYRVQRWSYGDVLRERIASPACFGVARHWPRRQGNHLGRELRRMGGCLLWLPAARRNCRSHRQDCRPRFRRARCAASGCKAVRRFGAATRFPAWRISIWIHCARQSPEYSAEPVIANASRDDIVADRLYVRHDRRTARCGDHPRQHPGQPRTAGAADRTAI